MTILREQYQHAAPISAPAPSQVVLVTRQKAIPTTWIERLFLVITIVLLPTEEYLPLPGGFSVMFLLFVIASVYVVMRRFSSIARIWRHPIFLLSYLLIFLSIVLEAASPSASYKETLRLAQMFIGAIVIAALCRDVSALKSCLLGYILMGIWVSLYLFLAFYGKLQGATAANFQEASQVRAEVLQENTLQANLNLLSFFVAQGAAVALALALMARAAIVRYGCLGITALCIIASFLPLSRGGTMITLLASGAVVLAYVGASRGAYWRRWSRIMALLFGLGMCVLVWVPEAVFARLSVNSESPYGPRDARTEVYTAALTHLPEYWLSGVGAGNFWGHWGEQSQFSSSHGVRGGHNGFIQITLYWGLPGLLVLASLVWYAYTCLPKTCGDHPVSLAVLGVVTALFFLMMVKHGLSFKGFSLGLGMVAGMHYWIWPAGDTQRSARVAVRRVIV